MRILLLGANGQLGTDLRRVLAGEVVGLDWPEFDLRRTAQVQAALHEHRPDYVINCAAQTNVDLCEDEPDEAFAINAVGALHVARCAEEIGAAVAYISTDYVFGAAAARAEPYREDDTPGPLNVYGAAKLAGEHLTLAYNTRALVVRTCGLYGHAGARGKGGNFVETMLRLAVAGRPIRVVNDQRLSPTSTAECAATLSALVQRSVRGLFHVAARDSCTWFEFAQAIFELEGLSVDLRPIASAEYPVRARRPALSALASQRLAPAGVSACRPWREMLQEYLATRPARQTCPSTPLEVGHPS
jgi:dTDP-4-dehydrorhamnose reductase